MADNLLKLDTRGRVTIATFVRRNSNAEPSALYTIAVAPGGTVTLTPVTIIEGAPTA